jgi:hypothetical protein
MWTSNRLLLYARHLCLGQRENISGAKYGRGTWGIVKKRVYNEVSAWNKNVDKKVRAYLGFQVIREKILACVLESMKRIVPVDETRICNVDGNMSIGVPSPRNDLSSSSKAKIWNCIYEKLVLKHENL